MAEIRCKSGRGEVALKHCPFCGRAPMFGEHHSGLVGEHYPFVRCECGARTGTGWTEEQAADLWNQRRGEVALVDEEGI